MKCHHLAERIWAMGSEDRGRPMDPSMESQKDLALGGIGGTKTSWNGVLLLVWTEWGATRDDETVYWYECK